MNRKTSIKIFFSFLFILVIAIVLRFWKLGAIPNSLYWDEVAIMIDAKAIAQTGHDMHGNHWLTPLFPSYGDYKLPVYIWLTSASIWLLGAADWVVRFPSALAGILTVMLGGVISFLLISRLNTTQTKASILAPLGTMLVLAVSPWSIIFSRTAFESHVGQFFLALSVALVLLSKKYILTKSNKSNTRTFTLIAELLFALSILAGAGAIYSYFSVRFVWPVVWSGAVLLLFTNRRSAKQLINEWKNNQLLQFWALVKLSIKVFAESVMRIVIGLITLYLLLQPMLRSPLYEVSNQFRLTAPSVLNSVDHALESNILREAGHNLWITRLLYHRHFLLLQDFAQNLSQNLSLQFIFVTGDSNLRHGTGLHGLFALPLIIPLIIGIYQLATKRLFVFLWLLSWILVALVPASVPMEVPHALRSLNALVPMAILIGFGISSMIDSFATAVNQVKKTSNRVCAFLTMVLLSAWILAWVLFLLHFLYFYFGAYTAVSKEFWQAGYKETAQEYLDTANTTPDEVFAEHPDDRFYLWILNNPEIHTSEIQMMQTNDYKPSKIRNIRFKNE